MDNISTPLADPSARLRPRILRRRRAVTHISTPLAEPPARAPPPLSSDLVENILVRLPPSEPASLFRAALVCKEWRTIISDTNFRRRFRELHRTPPLLGFICELMDDHYGYVSSFVRASSSCPPHADHSGWRPLDARHGRVLLRSTDVGRPRLVVWDPTTDKRWQLPRGAPLSKGNWLVDKGAVLCAASGSGACDHLDCHLGPFLVVLLTYGREHLRLCVYSSEAGTWSKPTIVAPSRGSFSFSNNAMVGNALYFWIGIPNNSNQCSMGILRYDLATRETEVLQRPESIAKGLEVVTAEGNLWSMEASPDGGMGWAHSRAIELQKLLPDSTLRDPKVFYSDFLGSARGKGVLFAWAVSDDRLFSFDAETSQLRTIFEDSIQSVHPYFSFYTPGDALGPGAQEGYKEDDIGGYEPLRYAFGYTTSDCDGETTASEDSDEEDND